MRHDKPCFCHGYLRSVSYYQSGKINEFYSLINNRKVNINTVLFSIDKKSEESAAEAGVGRGRIRLYHKHTLIMQMSHSCHSQLLPSSMLLRL